MDEKKQDNKVKKPHKTFEEKSITVCAAKSDYQVSNRGAVLFTAGHEYKYRKVSRYLVSIETDKGNQIMLSTNFIKEHFERRYMINPKTGDVRAVSDFWRGSAKADNDDVYPDTETDDPEDIDS